MKQYLNLFVSFCAFQNKNKNKKNAYLRFFKLHFYIIFAHIPLFNQCFSFNLLISLARKHFIKFSKYLTKEHSLNSKEHNQMQLFDKFSPSKHF